MGVYVSKRCLEGAYRLVWQGVGVCMRLRAGRGVGVEKLCAGGNQETRRYVWVSV